MIIDDHTNYKIATYHFSYFKAGITVFLNYIQYSKKYLSFPVLPVRIYSILDKHTVIYPELCNACCPEYEKYSKYLCIQYIKGVRDM